MSDEALLQARTMLQELTEAARAGQIIPVRLTEQLEAVLQTLDKARTDNAASQSVTPGLETYRQELAGLLSHGFHDMRLPLTSIRGYADMLANPGLGELSDMQKQFITTIRNNTRRMESLLNDVSDMSKIWNGTLKLSAKLDMFKNIALAVEKQMSPLAEELGRKLAFEIPQGLPILNTDGDLLAKALNKLVENALRYARAETEHLVKLSAAGEGNQLHIRIDDNGIGMTPEELSKLGTPYFRADHEAVLNHKGSGLGIPIAYGIIRLLGGSIAVTSEPGQGTAFAISLTGMTS
jgi:signal transduction histidine kinase